MSRSLCGKIAVVTGANSGIGEEAAANVLALGATVFLLVRSVAKGNEAVQRLLARVGTAGVDADAVGEKETGKRLDKVEMYGMRRPEAKENVPSAAARLRVVQCDLASLASVAAAAEQVRSSVAELRADLPAFYSGAEGVDLLLLNAGVMMCGLERTGMVDGDGHAVEVQLGTNHVGHFALFAALLPLLAKESATRVVVVSSNAHKFGSVDMADPTFSAGRWYTKVGAYGQSKAANLLFVHEAVRRIQLLNAAGRSNICVTAAHPGWTSTPLMRHSWTLSLISPLMGQSIEGGTRPILRALLDPDARSGAYFGPWLLGMWGSPGEDKIAAHCRDDATAAALWTWTETVVGMSVLPGLASASAAAVDEPLVVKQ